MPYEVQRALGITISDFRKKSGFSQLQLSERAALHLNTVQAIESGRYNVKVTTVFQIARGLGTSVAEIMKAVESMPLNIPTDSY